MFKLNDGIFALLLLAILIFTVVTLADRRSHVSIFISVLFFKIASSLLFFLKWPMRVSSGDAIRYLREMEQIAIAPWLWNPFLGTGPNYQVSAKMGMPYLYGVISYLLQTDVIVTALTLTIFFSTLTVILVYLIGLHISGPKVAILSMLLAAVHPEIIYWSGKILREGFAGCLVATLFLTGLKLKDHFRWKTFGLFLFVEILLILTRAQLALFGPIILAFVLVCHLKLNRTMILGLLCIPLLGTFGLSVLTEQLDRAAGKGLLIYLQTNPFFWLDVVVDALMAVRISDPGPNQVFGKAGLILLPFSVFTFIFFFASAIKFKKIFGAHWVNALLPFSACLLFLLLLHKEKLLNIRFRSPVIPLMIPIAVASFCYYFAPLAEFFTKKKNSNGANL